MTKLRLAVVFACLALICITPSSAFANGVRADLSASGRGVLQADCSDPTVIAANPACFEFSTVSATQATWEAFSLDFSTSVVTTTGPYDLFLVSGITDGTQVTLTLIGASDVFGSFLCGDDPTMTTQISGFCADPSNALGGDPSGIFSQEPSATDALGQATFIFNSSAPTTWVFFATEGSATISVSNGTTSATEPGTLLLLAFGAGMLAIAKLRKS